MRRQPRDLADAPGQDSFMDVVANLVGIMIILVMVVGARAKDAILSAAAPQTKEATSDESQGQLASAQAAATAVESDIHRIDGLIRRQDLEIAYRREERDRVQLLIAAANEAIAKRRNALDASQQSQFDMQRDMIAARAELDNLQRGRDSLEKTATDTAVITHLPTPMAKTVFGKELHFRLSQGRITHVPWDELVEALKQTVPQLAWRLKDEPRFSETLGPVGGFWMRYTLKRTQQMVPTRMGVSVQEQIELDHFTLVPVSENQGETVDAALQPGSQFRALIEQNKPAETTLTVWTYPDSYADYRKLKLATFQAGYLTASRPLPEGYPIGGSPHGTRSAAE